jgi:hypothetical protein
MAYLDSANRFNLTTSAPLSSTVTPQVGDWPRLSLREREVVLTRLEREAVMLARIDRKASLKPSGFLQKVGSFLFGIRQAAGLADPRLEALRRFAVAVAHDTGASVAREQQQLRELGLSEHQIARAADLASTHRRATAHTLPMQLIFFLLVACAYLFVDRYFESGIISLVTVVIPALPLWTMIAPRG